MLRFTTYELLVLSVQLRSQLRLYEERANQEISANKVAAPGSLRDLRSVEALVIKVEAELTVREQNTAFQELASRERDESFLQSHSSHVEIPQPDLDEIQKEHD